MPLWRNNRFRSILSYFETHYCLICKGPLRPGPVRQFLLGKSIPHEYGSASEELRELICVNCASRLPLCFENWARLGVSPYDFASVLRYEGEIRKAMLALKFQGELSMSWLFSLLAAYRLASLNTNVSAIIAVPLGPKRQKLRGYNQVEAWGELLAERLGVPLLSDVLYRRRESSPQTQMPDRRGREENMRGVFALNEGVVMENLPPGPWLLIDDVCTSGSTLRAAASALQKSGREFKILALARDEYLSLGPRSFTKPAKYDMIIEPEMHDPLHF